MKFYIASRTARTGEVRRIYDLLKNRGHEITVDWTLQNISRPYATNARQAREHSIQDIQGVRDSDIFVLISDRAGTGMYTELGVAISSHIDKRKPIIYIIGNHLDKSIFYFHPSINIRHKIEQVIEELENKE